MGLLARAAVKEVAPAVAFAAAGASNRPKVPILGNVLMRAESGALSFVGTDLDKRASSRAGVVIEGDGTTTVDATKITEWLNRHNESAEVIFEVRKGKLKARIDHSILELKTLPGTDFPAPFEPSPSAGVTLTEAEHKELFKQTYGIIP
jgi:DNA polymerase III subunit beta